MLCYQADSKSTSVIDVFMSKKQTMAMFPLCPLCNSQIADLYHLFFQLPLLQAYMATDLLILWYF